jgi:transcriptional regulator with XRE-family HTH domain
MRTISNDEDIVPLVPRTDLKALEATLRPMTLRQRFALLRSMYNLSQEELGTLIKRSRNAVSNWEAEEDNPRRAIPDATSRAVLGLVFGLPPSMFVDG